jgi:Ca2+-binding EF-hand superfamily protein
MARCVLVAFALLYDVSCRLGFLAEQKKNRCLLDCVLTIPIPTLNMPSTLPSSFFQFSNKLLGIGPAAQVSGASRSIVERVKNKIIERGGANGIRTCTRLLKRMDKDGSLSLDKAELLEGLMVYGIRNIDDTEGGDLDKLMKFFDRDNSGKISIEEFLRGVRGNMPGKRKKLVRQAYNCLDVTADGQVTIDDFIQAYDATHHPQVIAGEITPEEAVEEFMENFEKKESDGVLSWIEFLDYYKDISAGIEHDDYFELMIRNAWHMSGGEGWAANTSCRRVSQFSMGGSCGHQSCILIVCGK